MSGPGIGAANAVRFREACEEIAVLDIAAGQEPTLRITGERTVPGVWHENYWFRRHEAVYAAIATELDDAVVLEAGCGEGYGAQVLAEQANRVVALDYDAYAIAQVGRAYPALVVVRGNLVALPFADDTYDAVVSLQTVEHLWDQDAFVAACRRVLRPGGRLILSTPNRLTFPPGNPFHTRELSAAELRDLVARHRGTAALRGVRHGRDLTDWEHRNGSIVDAQLAAPPEQWPTVVAERVSAVGVGDFVLDDQMQTCLDLVAVATFD
jgi:SAM-dependent methyltransferase